MMNLPSRVADIRLFSEEGRTLLSQKKPLEGFSRSVEDSIKEATSEATNTVQKGHDYLIWMLTNVFEETVENAENAIIDGPDDCGIDAVLRYEDRKEITLIQSKFGESHDIGMIDKFVKDVERFKNAEQSRIKRDDLSYLWNEINQKNVKINLVYVTEQYAEYECDVVRVIDLAQTVQILSERKMKPEKGHKATINYLDGYQRNNIFYCTVKGIEIANLVDRNKYILDNNIRHHLGHRMKVNRGIRKTLEECPERFAEYNNGLTMTCVDFNDLEGKIECDSPIIVNGAQTSHGILDVSKKTKNLDAEIQLKVIKTDDEEQQKSITRFSNSQNAVKGKDLIALEDYWKSISYQIDTRTGYFFEYQSGSWDYRLDAGQRAKFQGNEIFNQYLPENHKKKLASKDAIQTYVAYFKQNPSGAYQSISKFLPGGAEYEKIFTEELMDDYRIFLFPTLIMECAKNELEYGPRNKTHPYKRYSTIFFVGVTGKIIHEYILDTKDDFDNDISKLESMIRNVPLFKKILRLTDKIVDQVLASRDLGEELEKVNNSPHNLFSKSIYNYEMKKVIEHYISLESEEIDTIKKTISGL